VVRPHGWGAAQAGKGGAPHPTAAMNGGGGKPGGGGQVIVAGKPQGLAIGQNGNPIEPQKGTPGGAIGGSPKHEPPDMQE